MLFGGVRKRLFVLIIDRTVSGQLALDGVDPLDESLNFAFRTAGLVRLRFGRDVLEFVGIRMRKIERELRARGADELIQNAGERMIVSSAVPALPPSERAPIAARPIATPACGISARPR